MRRNQFGTIFAKPLSAFLRGIVPPFTHALSHRRTAPMRIAFKTFGCRLNQAETARFAADFAAAGWQASTSMSTADVVVVHGCAVTHAAEHEGLCFGRGLKRAALAAGRPAPRVVLVGCVVEAGAAQTGVEGVDLIVPREQKARLAALVRAHWDGAVQHGSGPCVFPRRKRALLKIQDGCDFCCTYCIVPHTRGPPVSRPWQAVLDEAFALARGGARELVITGCNIASYHDGKRGLADLVAALVGLDDVGRVRLGSVEPGTIEGELVDLMAGSPKLCRHLHLPLQSGDAGILAAMHRRYTPAAYAACVCAAVRRLPDLGLGTDVIVGFPGETESAFASTQRLIQELPFSNLHVFPYSERQGTPAAELADAVPPAVRKARARALRRLCDVKKRLFAAQFVGRQVETLIERVDKDGCGWGWTGAYLECGAAGLDRAQIGKIVPVYPEREVKGGLFGRLRASESRHNLGG